MRVKKVLLVYLVAFVVVCCGLVLTIYIDWKSQTTDTAEEVVKEVYDETIVAVADFDYRPYSFIDSNGNPTGHDVDLINAISSKIKKNVEVHLVPWNKAEEMITDGDVDVLLGPEYSPEEYPNLSFTIPLGNDTFMVFGKKPLKNFGQLYTSSIALIRDAGQAESYLEAYHLLDNVVFFPTYTEVFEAVADGTCDYAVCRYTVGKLRASTVDRRIKPYVSLRNVSLSFAVRKGNDKLLAELDNAIIELAKDGTLDVLEEKWTGSYVKYTSVADMIDDYSVIIICLSVVFVVVLLLIALYYVFRKLRDQEKKVVRIDEKDVMMELYNRKGMEQRMKEVFHASGEHAVHAVFMLNINNFKKINDKFGYEKGNDVLKNMGQLLKTGFRDKDCVGRAGADEFVVLMTDARDEETVMAKAERVYKAIADFYNYTEMEGAVTASIGVAMFPKDGRTPDVLIKNASKALGTAKRKNKDRGSCALYKGEAFTGTE